MHVVTAGTAFIDIDVYGSSVALAELLRLQGEKAIAASSASFNASVSESLQSLSVQFDTDYKPSADDVFTIVDLSDPEHFDLGATPENVVMVVDHHTGFESFWREKLGDNAHIEHIGAACTQVYEIWLHSGLLDIMSKNSAKLLACGILDNTLNLGANITTERDKAAYADLVKRGNLPDDLAERYFNECQAFILANAATAIKNDSKTIQYPSLTQKVQVGQMALWDAVYFMNVEKDTMRDVLSKEGLPWYINLIDIHSGQSIFVCEDPKLKLWLAGLLDIAFEGNVATDDRMWLRKEIMKKAIEREGGSNETN